MSHLSIDDQVTLAESAADAPAHPHLAQCGQCRDDVEALRGALREASTVEVPEPSPLFWDHFSARVGRAVRVADPPVAAWWSEWRRWRVLAPLSVSVMALVLWVAVTTVRAPLPATADARVAAGTVEGPSPAAADAEADDPAWEVVTVMASDLDEDMVRQSGMAPSAGTVDNAVWNLSDRERVEFARLLRAELERGRSGS